MAAKADTVSLRSENKLAGILLYLFSLVLIVLISMIVKLTAERVPINQILLFRFAFSLVPLVIIGLALQRPIVLKTARPLDHAIRTTMGMAGIGFFFFAVNKIPLATATAIAYSAPIFCVVFSIPLLGEKIGVRRWCAVVLGFLGVLVMTRPGAEVFGIGSLAGIASALGGAMVVIYLRKLGETEAPLTTSLFYNATGAIVFAAWTMAAGWSPLLVEDFLWLLLLGLIAGAQQLALAHAFRHAEATLLAPLEYLVLVFAAIAGFLIWGEIPNLETWIGGTIIAAAGLFMLHRQRVSGTP